MVHIAEDIGHAGLGKESVVGANNDRVMGLREVQKPLCEPGLVAAVAQDEATTVEMDHYWTFLFVIRAREEMSWNEERSVERMGFHDAVRKIEEGEGIETRHRHKISEVFCA